MLATCYVPTCQVHASNGAEHLVFMQAVSMVQRLSYELELEQSATLKGDLMNYAFVLFRAIPLSDQMMATARL